MSMQDANVTEEPRMPIPVAEGVSLLDLEFQGTPGAIGSWLLAGDGEVALLEVGPASTRENLERMVARAGYSMADVSRLIVTHIHLDHAGAAGVLMRDYPNMRLTVHEDAAQFLTSVDRLWKSAARIYGDEMERLWGETIDVDPERLDPVRDGERLRIAGTSLLGRATPGHAGTHLSFLDEHRGVLFTGDAAGARMMDSNIVVPTLAPPELDFDLWEQSIEAMRELQPERLALTHMGVFEDVDRHLDVFMPTIRKSMEIAGRVLHSPEDEAALAEVLTGEMQSAYDEEGGNIEGKYRAMQLAMPTYLAAKGLVRVFKKSGQFNAA